MIKLKLKQGRRLILLLILGGDINTENFCLSIMSSYTNHASTDKDIHLIILSARILRFCSKGISYDLSRSYTPLDITRDPLDCLGVCRIMEGSSGYVVSRICEDTVTQLPRGSTSSIHELRTRGYKIFGYHGIRVPRSNLIGYLFLCSILRPSWDM